MRPNYALIAIKENIFSARRRLKYVADASCYPFSREFLGRYPFCNLYAQTVMETKTGTGPSQFNNNLIREPFFDDGL
ncbi:hypothetical protein Gasu2_46210 [Galdieria sulphuraria]|nr:hypothetical protein Gasu2_46210 [Galdieria sulphuraria]